MNPVISKATMGFIATFYIIFFVTAQLLMTYDGKKKSKTGKPEKLDFTFTNFTFVEPVQATGASSVFFGNTLIMFFHVHLMIFIGFGFLMTFLKRYARSSLGFTLLLSCYVIIWYIITHGFFHLHGKHIYVKMESLIKADVAAAAFLISFGAVLGKLNILQLFLMAFLETPIYAANEYLIEDVLLAPDAGGSVIVHVFGAFFGLGISIVHGLRGRPGENESDLEKSSYQSDINATIGTLFLWVFWPSFNAVLAPAEWKIRTVLNTYIALVSSCIIVSVLIISASKKKEWKLEMVYVQNATLASGVALGSSANLNAPVFSALYLGLLGGAISFMGYHYIQDSLNKKHVHDTCGVFSLHGLPGIIGGLGGALNVYYATKESYGNMLYEIYPGMKPSEQHRSRIIQGLFQLCSVCCGMIIGLIGGLITGALIVLAIPNLTEEEFTDDIHWEDDEKS